MHACTPLSDPKSAPDAVLQAIAKRAMHPSYLCCGSWSNMRHGKHGDRGPSPRDARQHPEHLEHSRICRHPLLHDVDLSGGKPLR